MDQTLQEAVQKMIDVGIPYLINIVAAIVIYVAGRWLAQFLGKLTETVCIKANVDKALAGFAKSLIRVTVLAFAVVAAFNKLGIATTSFVAILGAAGLAVGMALSGTLQNFAAGVMILLFKPFKLGDFIEAGGVMGTVRDIQIFHTVLSAPDNRKIIAPNSAVGQGVITNFSAIEKRRVDLKFSISYADNVTKAKEVLGMLVANDHRILKDPAPVIAVSALADSSVDIVCRPWVQPGDYWDVYFTLLEKGKEALEAAGISIPFPQRDVHLYSVDAKEI